MNMHQVSKINISPELVDCIVFWTKNPADMIPGLEGLEKYKYYFQFTLTGYGRDIEPDIPEQIRFIVFQIVNLTEICYTFVKDDG